ncbi:MAG: glycoside hydrolase family 43 protein [Planctomycetota bacterium]
MIQNPILPGFNPDPSIIRVGDDYYIATSTFEWFPGVPIYHSRDLQNWRLLTHALTRKSQLDLVGVDGAHGVWAPALSHDESTGRFYLIYTNLVGMNGDCFDLDNYVVTTESITGPWSEPTYLNSSGFDPSLFHDDDGRKWLVNLEWDFRQGYEHPGPIILQEFDEAKGQLVGPRTRIYRGGTDMGCMEAPHLYKRHGYYYLMAAEGGTGYGHAVTVARSKTLEGPYEPDPQNPIITNVADPSFNERGVGDSTKPHHYNPAAELQKSGHGSLVHTQDGTPYIPHLCARPVMPEQRCVLGRETSIQRCVWTDDHWLRLDPGNFPAGTTGNDLRQALLQTPSPDLPEHKFDQPLAQPGRDDFESDSLGVQYQTLRIPFTEDWGSLTRSPGKLSLRGQGSIFCRFRQSLVARRIQAFTCQAQTQLTFEPENYLQSAGLAAFYDINKFYTLRVYHSDTFGGKALCILANDLGQRHEYLDARLDIRDWDQVHLRARIEDGRHLRFSASPDGETWQTVGPVLDATKISDDYGPQCFTGAFFAIHAEDQDRKSKWAEFDYFEYTEG